jgi:glycosyltransferase involved in cell wall biosynthesis
MTPWVSILTPVYNGIEFLEQCAMSVCLQICEHENTKLEWEWWIGINGHGTGGEVLKKALQIKEKCPGFTIHVVNLPHVSGKVEALNALVERSAAEWIAVLDCDDTWDRKKLIFQKLLVEKTSEAVDVVGTFCHYFGDIVSNGPQLPQGFIRAAELWKGNPIINSSALIRRKYAHWEDRFGLEDYDMWLRLHMDGARLFNIPYHLVHHRIHTGSAFNGKGRQDLNGLIEYHRNAIRLKPTNI